MLNLLTDDVKRYTDIIFRKYHRDGLGNYMNTNLWYFDPKSTCIICPDTNDASYEKSDQKSEMDLINLRASFYVLEFTPPFDLISCKKRSPYYVHRYEHGKYQYLLRLRDGCVLSVRWFQGPVKYIDHTNIVLWNNQDENTYTITVVNYSIKKTKETISFYKK